MNFIDVGHLTHYEHPSPNSGRATHTHHMSHFGQLNNPHPMSRCPFCGATKPVVAWAACSVHCYELMSISTIRSWKLPLAPVGGEKPFEIKWSPMILSGGWH